MNPYDASDGTSETGSSVARVATSVTTELQYKLLVSAIGQLEGLQTSILPTTIEAKKLHDAKIMQHVRHCTASC